MTVEKDLLIDGFIDFVIASIFALPAIGFILALLSALDQMGGAQTSPGEWAFFIILAFVLAYGGIIYFVRKER